MATPHIESKKEDIAKIVLMPGDPKRAEYIAKNYLTDIKLVNQVRGMTAYTGYYGNKRITIFPSGMGIPSMSIYSHELFNFYNVDYIIRIGTMGAYTKDLNIGDVVLAIKSYTDSSYDKIVDNYKDSYLASSEEINTNIISAAKELNIELKTGTVYTSDVFYTPEDYRKIERDHNVIGVEMESFALFQEAKLANKNASAIFTISDSFVKKEELTSKEREKNLDDMIKIALKTSLKI